MATATNAETLVLLEAEEEGLLQDLADHEENPWLCAEVLAATKARLRRVKEQLRQLNTYTSV